jgi:hypothetical protein
VAEDLAIFAPSACLQLDGGAYLDVKGSAFIGYGNFKSNGTSVITGTLFVNGGVLSDRDFLYQAPSSTQDVDGGIVLFKNFEMVETKYTEQ